MPVTFDHNKQSNRERPLTVEGAIKVYANWSGLHDTDFYETLDYSSQTLNATAGTWVVSQLAEDVPYEFQIEYYAPQLGHGIACRYDEDGNYVLYGVDASSHMIAKYYDAVNAVWYDLLDIPVACPSEGDVIITFRELRHSDDPEDIWVAISMWVNDALIDSYTLYWGETMSGTMKIGLAGHNASITLENIRIPQLTEFAEWASLDPGETTMGGMTRVLEGRYVKYFVRYDGTLRAWRSQPTPASASFGKGDVYVFETKDDRREIFNHVRMMGAYEYAEYKDMGLIGAYGHKFTERNNPYLMSEPECYQQAQNEIRRMKERAYQQTIQTRFSPHLEPEDRVTTPSGDWIVDRREWSMQYGVAYETIAMRHYEF